VSKDDKDELCGFYVEIPELSEEDRLKATLFRLSFTWARKFIQCFPGNIEQNTRTPC